MGLNSGNMIQPTSKNSWHICKPIEECHTLFDGQSLGLWAHFFHCSCGKQEAYLSGEQVYVYQCRECANEIFLERSLLREPALYNAVDITYEYKEVEGGLKGIAYIDIPSDGDFVRQKISFERHTIAEIFRKYPATNVLSPKSFDETAIVKKLYKGLEVYALETYGDSALLQSFRENALDRSDKLSVILFFVKYPMLKRIEFYFWERNSDLSKLYTPHKELTTLDALIYLMNDRKERSLIKAVFDRHKELEREIQKIERNTAFVIDTINSFSPDSLFIICRCFEDPNIAVKLIREKALFHPRETDPIKLNDTIWLIMFLKKYYSEASIAKLLLSATEYQRLWIDTVRMAATKKRSIRREFKKVKLSIRRLHDAFMAMETKRGKALKFTYTNVQKKACIKLKGLEFRLPTQARNSTNGAKTYTTVCFRIIRLLLKRRRLSMVYLETTKLFMLWRCLMIR